MPSALIRALSEKHGLPIVDASSLEAFLAPAVGEAAHSLLFFSGDPKQRGESDDVAVVLPQILAAFRGELRGAVVARAAEDALKGRFHIAVVPSLAVVRGATPIAVLARIRDWAEYVRVIRAALAPDTPALAPSDGPKTKFTLSGAGAIA